MKNQKFDLLNVIIVVFCIGYIITFPLSVYEYINSPEPFLVIVPFFWLFLCFYGLFRVFWPHKITIQKQEIEKGFWRKDINLNFIKKFFTLKKMLIIFLTLLLFGAFYWYEYRPTLIKKECNIFAIKAVEDQMPYNQIEAYNIYFKICLNAKGLGN